MYNFYIYNAKCVRSFDELGEEFKNFPLKVSLKKEDTNVFYFSSSNDRDSDLPQGIVVLVDFPKDFTGTICVIKSFNDFKAGNRENGFARGFVNDEFSYFRLTYGEIPGYGYYSSKAAVSVRGRKSAFSVTILRYKNGKLHSEAYPAAETKVLRLCEYIRDGKTEVETNRERSSSQNHYLNGTSISEAKKKVAVEKGIDIKTTSRLKLYGSLRLGEELECFGDDGLVWVRNGQELWALDLPYRTKSIQSRYIGEQRRKMLIDENDKTRFFLVDSAKLEEIVVNTMPYLLTGTTAD